MTKRMRVVIDLQGAQTVSRYRGIGRYTLSLTQALIRIAPEHDIHVVLSGLFPETLEPLNQLFKAQIEHSQIHIWHAPTRVSYQDPKNRLRRERAQKIYSHFLLSLKPDVILLTSVFEGFGDDAVTCISPLVEKVPCAAIFYDLIPLLNPALYLDVNPLYAQFYREKIRHFQKASLWLAISESAAQEGISALDLPSSAVVNISAACDAIFYPRVFTPDEASVFLHSFGITQSFILYTGGSDTRKNLPRLIQAYANLPTHLQTQYQLVLAGRVPAGNLEKLLRTIKQANVPAHRICFTGYVSDEQLASLYSLCHLFVMPSLHEGFGLPPLEAMACGAVAIGANTTSLPEVIGDERGLFDPYDEAQITQKMAVALTDEPLRDQLRAHGKAQAQKFSWEFTAGRTLRALENLVAKDLASPAEKIPSVAARQRLALVSPMPPARSGIADYSALLLPYLLEFYDITLVLEQPDLDFSCLPKGIQIQDPSWLKSHSDQVDRVLYQMGNSPFHAYMLELMELVPGVVVLHDFFLSGLFSYLEKVASVPQIWTKNLYHSHGYAAVAARYQEEGDTFAKEHFPVNLTVLENARGIIVHSPYALKLGQDWYGKNSVEDWKVIALLRPMAPVLTQGEKIQIRQALGIAPDDFVVCSFGFLDPTKLNHRLLDAWLRSDLAKNPRCKLIFVGQNHGADYGQQLLETIASSECTERIHITGWASTMQYEQYLALANSAVQLRTASRGETSAAVLDCLSFGLPTIVNANGSMANLSEQAVLKLADEFDDAQLTSALESLWHDRALRERLAHEARTLIAQEHSPQHCAHLYHQAIEQCESAAQYSVSTLVGQLGSTCLTRSERHGLADALVRTFAIPRPQKQLLLDLSATCSHDLKTGIERVARSLALSLLQEAPDGYRVEPVYLETKGDQSYYRYARRYCLDLLHCPRDLLEDAIVEVQEGDVLITLDLSGARLLEAARAGLYQDYRQRGVRLYSVVYDLLPLQFPQYFPPGTQDLFLDWLEAIAQWDGALCISQTVAQDLRRWMQKHQPERVPGYQIEAFALGSDLTSFAPSLGMPDFLPRLQTQLEQHPSFLMVGTIEPRKGYLQTLEAFSLLWERGIEVNLIIVGKLGWTGLPDAQRRTIPATEQALRKHPLLGKRLFWFESASDVFLQWLYQHSTALICASQGEGFGLPLIEAAQMGMPLIARDLPVFREVAKDGAYYFSGDHAPELALAIQAWLGLYRQSEHPLSAGIGQVSWQESADQLLKNVLA